MPLLLLLLTAALISACEGAEAPAVTAPSRDDHDRWFPIEQGNHEGITCNECHGRFDTFRHFSCIDCHEHTAASTNPIHEGIPGYAWGDETCYPCHPRGEAEGAGVAHEAIFPIAPSTAHGEIACMECHETRADRSKLLCAGCHSDVAPDHARIGGFQADSARCVRCHADSQVDRVDAHLPFAIQAGTPHVRQDCLACHPSTRADKDFGADWRRQSCANSCHPAATTDPLHAGFADYAWQDAACLTCHPAGSATGGIEHEAIFPIAAGTAHEGIGCDTCHADATSRENVTCTSGECHPAAAMEPRHPPADVPDFAAESALCKRCHADAQVDRVADHDFRIEAGAPHERSGCLECHAATRADKAFGADFSRAACTGCHERAETTADHVGVGEFEYADGACLLCHPDGAAAIDVDHRPIFPIAAGSVHAAEGVGCMECHASAADREQVLCATCHAAAEMSPAHTNVRGFAQVSQTCLRCHADSQVDPVRTHDGSAPIFLIASGDHRKACWDCHTSSRADRAPYYVAVDFGPFDCFGGCHEHSRSEMDAEHRGEPGYDGSSRACLNSGCHPDGRKED